MRVPAGDRRACPTATPVHSAAMTDDGTYPLAEEPPPPPPIWPDVVPEGPTCRRCGYELKGLPMKGQCPECALPVVRSLRGNLLEYSDPAYVGRLASGALLLEMAIVGFCALPIGAIFALIIGGAVSMSASAVGVIGALCAIVSVVASIFGLLGLFVITSRDPALVGRDESDRSRLVTRWATVVCAVSWATLATISLLPRVASAAPASFGSLLSLSGLGATIALWVQIIASLCYLRHLAARFPDAGLREEIRGTRVLAVTALCCLITLFAFVFFMLGCVGMVFGLVVVVLLLTLIIRYAIIVDRTRRRLGQIARSQARAVQ